MKDRQFMVILGLVVAAGLVMGLIASRMTGRAPAVETASTDNATSAKRSVPEPYTVEVPTETQPDALSQSSGAQSQNGEPTTTDQDAPPMQGPTNGDPPPVATPAPTDAGGEPSQ